MLTLLQNTSYYTHNIFIKSFHKDSHAFTSYYIKSILTDCRQEDDENISRTFIYFVGGGKLGLTIFNGTASVSVQMVGGLEFRSVPLSDMLESSSSGFTSESSTTNAFGVRSFCSVVNGRIVGDGCGSSAASQTCFINLKVESLDRREQNTCLSSSVAIATAFGMIRAVFSLLIFNTETVGIKSFVT